MRSWAVPAAIIVAVEYVFALVIGARVGFHYRIPFETYVILGLAVAGIGLSLIICAKLVIYTLEREDAPTRRLLSETPYMAGFVAGVTLSALQIAVLTWTKVMLPIASPFWADPLLARADQLLFRVDPWIVARGLFGWAASLIDRAYVTWAPVKFATFLFLVCTPQTLTKSRCLIAYFLMMATVAMGQFLFSSGGPIFYERLGYGLHFASLPVEPWVRTTSAYLWRDHLAVGGEIGGGISAMPSLHVAAALWIALVWRSYSRLAGALAFAYFSLIAIGSVLLGWHYAVDGIAAALITAASWKAAKWLLRPGAFRFTLNLSPPVAGLGFDRQKSRRSA